MLIQVGHFLTLIALFFLLGKSADFLIDGIRVLGARLKIKTIYLGFVLGFLTTLPELFIGIHAISKDAGEIAFGNLIGGVIVLLGFVMGLNVILQNNIKIIDGLKKSFLVLMGLYLILPLIFILDGSINFLEGIALIIFYVALISFWLQKRTRGRHEKIDENANYKRAVIFAIFGIVGIIIFSRFIISVALLLLEGLNISKLMMGIIVFSIGTNLPEIIVVFESWRKKVKNIALGNLLGSATTNIFIIGTLSLVKPFSTIISPGFFVFSAIFILIIALFIYFARTKQTLHQWEGAFLVGTYLLFLIFEFLLTGVNGV